MAEITLDPGSAASQDTQRFEYRSPQQKIVFRP
jgi:hypothetical protein